MNAPQGGPYDYSYPAAGAPPPAPPNARPAQVSNSFRLWLVCLACYLIGIVLSLPVMREAMAVSLSRAQAQMQTPNLDPATVHRLTSLVLTMALVIAVVPGAVWLLFIMKMYAGRRWARTVLAVISVPYLLLYLFGLLGTASGATAVSGVHVPASSIVLNILDFLLVVAANVLMFRPAANVYFSTPSRPGPPPGQPPAPRYYPPR